MDKDIPRFLTHHEVIHKPCPDSYPSPGDISTLDLNILRPMDTSNDTGYLLHAIDDATGYSFGIEIPDTHATTIADHLFHHVISSHGPPRHLHSREGREFTKQVATALQTRHATRTNPCSPEDQVHQITKNTYPYRILRIICNDHPRTWKTEVQAAIRSLNTRPAPNHKHSPYEQLFCKTSNLLRNQNEPDQTDPWLRTDTNHEQIRPHEEQLALKEAIHVAQNTDRIIMQHEVNSLEYQPGDLAFVPRQPDNQTKQNPIANRHTKLFKIIARLATSLKHSPNADIMYLPNEPPGVVRHTQGTQEKHATVSLPKY